MSRERLAGVNLVTRRLHESGTPEVELVRGKDYHYFVFDNGAQYHTYSVMIPNFRAWSAERWEQEGREFAKACRDGKYDDASGRLQ